MFERLNRTEVIISPDHIHNIPLEEAAEQMGGFGRFQVLVCIIMALIRNFGMIYVYLAAMSVRPQKFLCQTDPHMALRECSVKEICELKLHKEQFLVFKQDLNDPGHL